jgi:hypothetical protein
MKPSLFGSCLVTLLTPALPSMGPCRLFRPYPLAESSFSAYDGRPYQGSRLEPFRVESSFQWLASHGLPIEAVIFAQIVRRRHLFQHHIYKR